MNEKIQKSNEAVIFTTEGRRPDDYEAFYRIVLIGELGDLGSAETYVERRDTADGAEWSDVYDDKTQAEVYMMAFLEEKAKTVKKG